ncbi:MAG TPA: hypothetical protein VFJ87_05200 [Rhodanobacteraceae bacterium]|jgi:hypothetical protein|nr:hypothetical protein [Rhodanobacteraceae bacterium]
MLMIALYVVGGVLLLIGAIALLVGGVLAVFLPQLILGGAFLILALALERWRYKPVRAAGPDPGWTDTGERFVDPETGLLTTVYFDAAKGERHYLATPASDKSR